MLSVPEYKDLDTSPSLLTMRTPQLLFVLLISFRLVVCNVDPSPLSAAPQIQSLNSTELPQFEQLLNSRGRLFQRGKLVNCNSNCLPEKTNGDDEGNQCPPGWTCCHQGDDHSCAPPGNQCCGSRWCATGSVCCSKTKTCCPSNTHCCGTECCNQGYFCCNGGDCCKDNGY